MSDVIEYVVNSFAWSVIGFVVGWLGASLRSDIHTLKEALVPTEEARAQRLKRTQRSTRLLGVIVAVLAVATVVQGVIAQQRLNDVSRCQAQYNERFAAASKTRADLADEDRRALNRMLLTLYQKRDASEQERLGVFERWVRITQRNERHRPQLPEYPIEDEC